MAAAVMVMVPQYMPAGMFKGDSVEMLDRLVEACQQKPKAVLPGYGRDLEPCNDAWLDPSCDVTSPSKANKGQKTARGPCKAVGSPKHSDKKAKTAFPKVPKSAAKSVPATAQGSVASSRRASLDACTPIAIGCPSLAASPKPEALPMPTVGLLSRARRSPSPEKAAAPVSPCAEQAGALLLRRLQAVQA